MLGELPPRVRLLEVTRPGPRFVLRERAPEAPRPGEVLVAVHGCAFGEAELLAAAAAPSGACLGRALCGVVTAAPEDEPYGPGTFVVAPARQSCGACPACRRGRSEACQSPPAPWPGGLASHARVSTRDLVPLRDGLERLADLGWRLAAAGDALLLAYHGLARVGLAPGEVAVFVGLDATAQCGVRIAASQGAAAIAVDPCPARLEAARAAGARAVVDARGAAPGDLAVEVERRCAAEGLGTARRTVVARAGGTVLLARATALVQPGGALLLLGRPTEDAVLETAPLARRGATLVALEDGHPELLTECLALCARGDVSLEPVTRAVAPDQVDEARERMHRGDDARSAVVRFEEPPSTHIDTPGATRG